MGPDKGYVTCGVITIVYEQSKHRRNMENEIQAGRRDSYGRAAMIQFYPVSPASFVLPQSPHDPRDNSSCPKALGPLCMSMVLALSGQGSERMTGQERRLRLVTLLHGTNSAMLCIDFDAACSVKPLQLGGVSWTKFQVQSRVLRG
ncbi:hypothetical protein V2G26_006580 [Clonostachys chloroleuca]